MRALWHQPRGSFATGSGDGGRAGGRTAGFTLLELVVAMAVFGVVCLGIYGVLVLGARSASSGERVTEQSRRFRVATELMTRQIASAAAISLPRPDGEGLGSEDDASEPLPYFFGDSAVLEFVTTASQRPDASGLAIVRYWLEDGMLKISETPAYEAYRGEDALGGEEGLSGGAEATLLFDVDSLKLSYRRERDGEEWLESWDAAEEDALPAVVRLEVTPAVVDGPSWYEEAPVMVGTFNELSGAEDFGRIRGRVKEPDPQEDPPEDPPDETTTTTVPED